MELKDYREQIDAVDRELVQLFLRRMELAGQIGDYKREQGLPILDASREEQKLEALEQDCPPALRGELRELYRKLFDLSTEFQQRRSPELSCGLLGRKLGHSYSPQIHEQLGAYSYSLFEREPEELADCYLKLIGYDR